MHVNSSILERSLLLNEEVINLVPPLKDYEYPYSAEVLEQQVKLIFLTSQRTQVMKIFEAWGKLMWKSSSANLKNHRNWTIPFCVLVVMIMVMEKSITSSQLLCEARIQLLGSDAKAERARAAELTSLIKTQLFERFKEIFHLRFKTRKGGMESCNPIRDGLATMGVVTVDEQTTQFLSNLVLIVKELGKTIPSGLSNILTLLEHEQASATMVEGQVMSSGSLVRAFIDDFVGH